MNNKDYIVGPRKGGRSYTYIGQKVPNNWVFKHKTSGKVYDSKEAVEKALAPKKKRVTKKKVEEE